MVTRALGTFGGFHSASLLTRRSSLVPKQQFSCQTRPARPLVATGSSVFSPENMPCSNTCPPHSLWSGPKQVELSSDPSAPMERSASAISPMFYEATGYTAPGLMLPMLTCRSETPYAEFDQVTGPDARAFSVWRCNADRRILGHYLGT